MIKETDGVIKHGSIMLIANGLGSAFNMLYQLYMVRNLNPVDYGILNSLLALLLIISVPAGTLQTAVTKYTAGFHAHNQLLKIRSFLLRFAKEILLFSSLIFIIILLGSRYISNFFQIPTSTPVILVGILMLFSIVQPITLGGLQGMQMFGWLGINGIIGAGMRLAFGILLVSMGLRVLGALSAIIIANLFIIIISIIPLRPYLITINSTDVEKINFMDIYKYFIPVAVTFLCFMALIGIDIILVKHFFAPLEAGFYSIAQMGGKIILFFPMTIVIVMFPKVSSLHSKGADTVKILKKCLLLAALLCAMGVLGYFLFPSLIIKILSGKDYIECIPLVRLFAIAMAFYAITHLLLFYQLSIRYLKFMYPLIFFTALQTVMIIFFHNTLSQVLYILCVTSVLLCLINLKLSFAKNK